MRTMFEQGARHGMWSYSMGEPMSMGQTDILKELISQGGQVATSYEKTEQQKAAADQAAAQAKTAAAAAQAAAANAAAAQATNPTILGIPQTAAIVGGLGILALVGILIATKKK